VFYVLGKAYYFKGGEYAELCVENLEKAREYLKNADDLYEYLGLAYAELGDFSQSVEAFAHTLDRAGDTPADELLLAIARSYIALGEYETAGMYLNQCLAGTRDVDAAVAARLLLGGIFREKADYRAAEEQYMAVLTEAGELAAVHYELGELYQAEGNTALARSEWRKANRIDPAYAPAVNRLNNRSGG
jgi:tetratricopeptide (TPR) repeat protein